MNEGIVDVITDILQSQDKKLILTGTDILILFLNQDPNLTRSFVTQQDGVPLLGFLFGERIVHLTESIGLKLKSCCFGTIDSIKSCDVERNRADSLGSTYKKSCSQEQAKEHTLNLLHGS